jgi:hypothetical protein
MAEELVGNVSDRFGLIEVYIGKQIPRTSLFFGDKISCLSWILWKNMPDVGLRERNLTLCLNGLKIFENY